MRSWDAERAAYTYSNACANLERLGMRGESMGSYVSLVSSFFYISVRAAYLH